jgi:hypothetical protein
MRIAILHLVAAAFMLSASGCDSHLYYTEAAQYVKVSNSALIQAGLCSTEQDCKAKQLIFWEAGGIAIGPVRTGGVHINLYQQSSLEFVTGLELEFLKLRSRVGGPSVTLTAFSSRHSEEKRMLKQVILK